MVNKRFMQLIKERSNWFNRLEKLQVVVGRGKSLIIKQP